MTTNYDRWRTASPNDEAGIRSWAFVCDTQGCPERGTVSLVEGRDYDEAADRAESHDFCIQCGWGLMRPEDAKTAIDEWYTEHEQSRRTLATSPRPKLAGPTLRQLQSETLAILAAGATK